MRLHCLESTPSSSCLMESEKNQGVIWWLVATLPLVAQPQCPTLAGGALWDLHDSLPPCPLGTLHSPCPSPTGATWRGPGAHLCAAQPRTPRTPHLGTHLSVASAHLLGPCPREGGATSIPLSRNKICPCWSPGKHPSSTAQGLGASVCKTLGNGQKGMGHGELLPQ